MTFTQRKITIEKKTIYIGVSYYKQYKIMFCFNYFNSYSYCIKYCLTKDFF